MRKMICHLKNFLLVFSYRFADSELIIKDLFKDKILENNLFILAKKILLLYKSLSIPFLKIIAKNIKSLIQKKSLKTYTS